MHSTQDIVAASTGSFPCVTTPAIISMSEDEKSGSMTSSNPSKLMLIKNLINAWDHPIMMVNVDQEPGQCNHDGYNGKNLSSKIM